jgi:hypothetical protein
MAGSHPHRQRASRVPVRRAPQPCDKESLLAIESDLSAEMAVGHQELEAILRLLDGNLDDLLLDTRRH